MTQAVATNQTIPVVGGARKEAGLDGHVIRARKLEEIGVKVVPVRRK
jgi:hypothetical protein